MVIVGVVRYSGPPRIEASGTGLLFNGTAYRFTGVNAYELATEWGVNAGCGANLTSSQLKALFSSLPPNSLVRFWAFQGTMATNTRTGEIDWQPINRIFSAAAAHGQRLIPVITDQGGTCDGGHWQDPDWYDGGFKAVYNSPSTTDGTGRESQSYWTYLQEIVNRYKDSPALGMWEPISEAEASSCPSADQPANCLGHQICPDERASARALRHFFDVVGARIHSLDPNHLVESGLLGGDQCGIVGADYKFVSASSGIDVMGYHDYYGYSPKGSAGWQVLETRMRQARSLNKPFIAGEVGMKAGPGPGCVSLARRNRDMESKISELAAVGVSGSLVWNWTTDRVTACSYDVGPLDPLMRVGGAVG